MDWANALAWFTNIIIYSPILCSWTISKELGRSAFLNNTVGYGVNDSALILVLFLQDMIKGRSFPGISWADHKKIHDDFIAKISGVSVPVSAETVHFLKDWLVNVCCTIIKVTKTLQKSLADAKVSARQPCVYEGPSRRNLTSAENRTLEPNITSIRKPVAKL